MMVQCKIWIHVLSPLPFTHPVNFNPQGTFAAGLASFAWTSSKTASQPCLTMHPLQAGRPDPGQLCGPAGAPDAQLMDHLPFWG